MFCLRLDYMTQARSPHSPGRAICPGAQTNSMVAFPIGTRSFPITEGR